LNMVDFTYICVGEILIIVLLLSVIRLPIPRDVELG